MTLHPAFLLPLVVITLGSTPVFANGHGHEEHAENAEESHAHAPAAASAQPSGGAQGSWDAFNEMKAGNKRFFEGKAMHPKQDQSTREGLAKGQTPHTIVLSCSDSRVPPEIVFDQGLGQVFSVRTAGHVLDSPSIASIEYAVEHLGTTLIVVMGHESCGAVKAALATPPGQSTGSPHIDALVTAIRPGLRGRTVASGDTTLREHVKSNTIATTKTLIEKSKIVRERLSSGKLMIAQGIYSLATGRVDFWDVGSMATLAAEDHADEGSRSPASAGKPRGKGGRKPHGEHPAPAAVHGEAHAH